MITIGSFSMTTRFHTPQGKRKNFWKARVYVCYVNIPDLNVIENCWHVLSQNIYMNGAANNLADLRRKVNSAIATFNN